jgi:putative YhbY family RNA-binding protein
MTTRPTTPKTPRAGTPRKTDSGAKTRPAARTAAGSRSGAEPFKNAAAQPASILLSPAQRSALRSQAHALNPVVLIGADGLTPAVLAETEVHLKAHGLIKIRVFGDDRDHREAVLEELCTALEAAPVQHIGKLLVIYRPLPDTSQAPKAAARPTARTGGTPPREVTLTKPSRSGRSAPSRKVVNLLGTQRVTAGGKVKRAKPRQKSLKKLHSAD